MVAPRKREVGKILQSEESPSRIEFPTKMCQNHPKSSKFPSRLMPYPIETNWNGEDPERQELIEGLKPDGDGSTTLSLPFFCWMNIHHFHWFFCIVHAILWCEQKVSWDFDSHGWCEVYDCGHFEEPSSSWTADFKISCSWEIWTIPLGSRPSCHRGALTFHLVLKSREDRSSALTGSLAADHRLLHWQSLMSWWKGCSPPHLFFTERYYMVPNWPSIFLKERHGQPQLAKWRGQMYGKWNEVRG